MIAKKGDSPAFPSWCPETMNGPEYGISLRDYFAAKAQSGMLANYNVINTPEHVAKMAYAHADAMLAERAK